MTGRGVSSTWLVATRSLLSSESPQTSQLELKITYASPSLAVFPPIFKTSFLYMTHMSSTQHLSWSTPGWSFIGRNLFCNFNTPGSTLLILIFRLFFMLMLTKKLKMYRRKKVRCVEESVEIGCKRKWGGQSWSTFCSEVFIPSLFYIGWLADAIEEIPTPMRCHLMRISMYPSTKPPHHASSPGR